VLGLYVPGDSLLHRARAGLKLALLALGLSIITLLATPAAVLVALAVAVALAAIARLPPATVLAQVRPLAWVLVIVGAAQVWLGGWRTATVVCGSLLVAVLGAALVTLTTRTQDLLDALVGALRPLRRLGVDPDRVALVLALVIRSVPVLARIVEEVHQARVARGAQRSMRAFAVPVVIRTVRYADRLGEALIARGADDPDVDDADVPDGRRQPRDLRQRPPG
jgi:biotin transport system permease protein